MRRGTTGRVYGYVRVSSRRQDERGTSPEGQRDEIVAWCKARGLPEPEICFEVESAGEDKIERRVKLHDVIGRTSKGDLVVVSKVDRWSRDIVFAVDSVRKLIRRGIDWHSIGEAIDASTPHGETALSYMALSADQERRRIKERTVGRRRSLAEQGYYVHGGDPPVGYLRGDRAKREHLILVPDPKTAPIVVELFERCANGQSIDELIAWLQTTYPRSAERKTVGRMLRSRVPIGYVWTGSEWVPGKHPPIISRDLWERAQEGLTARRPGGRRPKSELSEDAILRGLSTCTECGRRVSVIRVFPRGKSHVYYACQGRVTPQTQPSAPVRPRCTAKFKRVENVDPLVIEAARARLVELRGELSREPARTRASERAVDFEADRERLRKRRDRLVDLFADGGITREELRAKLSKIQEDEDKIARREGDAGREEQGKDPKARAAALADVRKLDRMWARMSPADRREVLRLLSHKIELAPDGKPQITWKSAAEMAADRLRNC